MDQAKADQAWQVSRRLPMAVAGAMAYVATAGTKLVPKICLPNRLLVVACSSLLGLLWSHNTPETYKKTGWHRLVI